jgi:hypothetical protein
MEPKSKPEAISRAEMFKKMLDEAIIYGYDVLLGTSFDFSPIEIVLDCAVDILLLLRQMFEEGSKAAANNAGLGFSQVYSDVLGNPKQFKISFPSKYYWDPAAREIFFGLAQTFIEIKSQKSITKCFHDFCENFDLKSSTPTRGKNQHFKKKAQYHWWRRQQRRIHR